MNTSLWSSQPVRFLEGERVYLRPIEQGDAEGYFHMLFNPEVRRLTGTRQAFTLEGIQRYIDDKSSDASTVFLLIALSDNDEVIGDIVLQDVDSVNRNAGVRIAIFSEKHQSNGYGPEAMRLLLEYGFGQLNLHRIELEVFGYNERAMKAYEKVGFIREGIRRDVLFYNHEYHDSITMSMLEEEFKARYHGSK